MSKVKKTEYAGLERLSKLLAFAPQDRVWRRRGFLVLCRANTDRLRLTVEISDTAGSVGQPLQRPKRRSRKGQVKVEIMTGGKHSGQGGGSASTGTRAAREGSRDGRNGGEFDAVAAWLMGLTDEDVFRRIVGFY